jgi:hypothetical protein
MPGGMRGFYIPRNEQVSVYRQPLFWFCLTELVRHDNYTRVWNALDYPALVFPVSNVNPAIDLKKPAHKFLNQSDEAWYKLCTLKPLARHSCAC